MSFDRPGYLYYHLSTSAQSVGKSSWLAILFLRNKPLSLHCRWPNITRQVVYYNLKKRNSRQFLLQIKPSRFQNKGVTSYISVLFAIFILCF